MLTAAQKRQLKSLAMKLTNRYQIGKNEITDTVIDMLDKALTAHELIKVDISKNASEEKMQIALDLSSRLNADLVQVVGRVVVLFRRNKQNPKIQLVK